MDTNKVIRVVLVSPNDVTAERDAFEEAIKMANQVASRRRTVFELRRWEDVSPGYHPEGTQALIDSELNIEKCDLLVGIFWKRFGVIDPPPYSRTAWEILRGLEVSRNSATSLDVKVYFSNRPYFPTGEEEAEEQARVLKFRHELQKQVLYRVYGAVEDFRFHAFVDLIEYLDKATAIHELSDPPLSLQVSSNPRLLRAEGLTELTADLRLSLTGTIPSSWVGDLIYLDINVFPQTGVGNRTTDDGFSDIVLIAGSEIGSPLARGRIGEQYANGISFAGVGIAAKDSALHQDLWIRGIRCKFGFSLMSGQPLSAVVAVTVTRGKGDGYTAILAPESAILGIPVRSTQFHVCKAFDEISWPDKDEGTRIISTFTVHFREAFPGAFKTREEESGQSPETAAYGNILRISGHSIPKHFDIFVTVRDLPDPSSPAETLRAVAVQIEHHGRPLNRIDAVSPLLWNTRRRVLSESRMEYVETLAQTPLVQIDRSAYNVNLADHFDAGWELVSNASITAERELVFGVVITGPEDWPPKEVSIYGRLAPECSLSAPRGSYPVPGFASLDRPVDLVIETTDDAFDPFKIRRQKCIDELTFDNPELLTKEIDRANFEAYLLWRFPGHRLEANDKQIEKILEILKTTDHSTLGDLDAAIVPWYPRLAEFYPRFENYFKSSAHSFPNPANTAREFDSAAVRFATLLSIVDDEFRDKSFAADWTENLVRQFTEMRPIRAPR